MKHQVVWSACKHLVAVCHTVCSRSTFWGLLRSAPRVRDRIWPFGNTPTPSCVIIPNLVIRGQTVRARVVRKSAGKMGLASRLSRSLKVIGTYTGISRVLWLPVSDPR